LQWFTGNIGFHHIHHLSPRIPNYYLEKCQRENPLSQRVRQITLLSSLKSLTFRLWDEEHRMLVGYKVLRNYRRSRAYEQ
ncbi:MAG: fatty acid desaturase, partial [Armatimonadetes bacterium CG_4_9_14_3_um_filter_58_7]